MNFYSIFLIFLSILTKRNIKEHKKTNQGPPKKLTIDIPQPESFPPTEELPKYKQLMEILKPYCAALESRIF